MEIKEILSKVDHTLLKPESTWEQIKEMTESNMKQHQSVFHHHL